MAKTMREILADRRVENFVGRSEEMKTLMDFVETDAPAVVHVHGLGGIGKSALCHAFVKRASEKHAFVFFFDCKDLEPSSQGFFSALESKLELTVRSLEDASAALADRGERVVLVLDTYEIFRMMDTWLRNEFLPSLSENSRVFFFGRERPVSAWLISPEWQGIFHSMIIGPIDEAASATILRKAGVQQNDIDMITSFTGGNPLALRLAAATVLERPDIDLGKITSQTVVAELTRTYLSDVQDAETRFAVEASAVVRRMNQPLLQFMFPNMDSRAVFEKLQELPFIETAIDGLVLHDSVHQSIMSTLHASDPSKFRELRKKAWSFYRNEVRLMARSEIWRYSADMLYLIEQPLIKNAFFPTNLQPYAMEIATPEDRPVIKEIIRKFEGKEGARILCNWLDHGLDFFTVARDHDGEVAGFYILFNPREVKIGLLREDPVSWRLYKHLEDDPTPPNQKAIFCRRWLDAKTGENNSPVIGACFLDVKGYYVAMKPNMRRLYCTRTDYDQYAPLFGSLLFKYLKSYTAELDGTTYHTDLLDFGPALFNGWVTALVGSELGIDRDNILDVAACEIVLDEKRIGLTKLELGVMQCLEQNEGDVVKRDTLLEEVWGYGDFTGSNVVDNKIRSLRKKMGDYAPMIETVSGVGYRYKRIG
jgi:hypothetical protein